MEDTEVQESQEFVPAPDFGKASIHPRVRGGRRTYDLVNTCMKPKKETIQRKISAIEEHLERHPRDTLSQRHLSKLRDKL